MFVLEKREGWGRRQIECERLRKREDKKMALLVIECMKGRREGW